MNPFTYQGPATPELLIDRRSELDALQSAAADRIATRLAAPRRFGKSSLLDAHVESMRRAGHRAVRVDLAKVGTVSDVAARVAAAYGSLPRDPHRVVRRWTERLGVSAGVPGFRVSVRPAARPTADDARAALLELLEVPQALHQADGELTVVCFDEIQDLLVADDDLDGLVRSVIQHHGRAAAYVFAGSEPSLIRELFEHRERPFYGQARPLALPGLPLDESANDIARLLGGAGFDGDDLADAVAAIGRGHPQRTMLLAHHLYNVLDEAAEQVEDPAEEALARALRETADAHQAVWDNLDRPDRIVVLTLADGEAPSGSRTATEHRIPRSTLQSALERLVAAEEQVQRGEDGRPRLIDPLFEIWLRQR